MWCITKTISIIVYDIGVTSNDFYTEESQEEQIMEFNEEEFEPSEGNYYFSMFIWSLIWLYLSIVIFSYTRQQVVWITEFMDSGARSN